MSSRSPVIRVLRPGILSTVQDLGRSGLQHLGIVPCGAMDTVSHRLANALVGNAAGEATVEITVLGPELRFETSSLIALCGARFEASVNGAPCPLDRPVLVGAGARLLLGRALLGARCYLAIAGGIAVRPALGSRSTYVPAGFGGFAGRALLAGDQLELRADVAQISAERFERLVSQGARLLQAAQLRSVRWSTLPMTMPNRDPIIVRALTGMHAELFDDAAKHALFDSTWRVAAESNRIGYRLLGPVLSRRTAGDVLSGPTCLGTVQVPISGQPIVLMADHQTTGGYPKLAEVISADVARLGQLLPGARLRFMRCDLEEALKLRHVLAQRLTTCEQAISSEYGN